METLSKQDVLNFITQLKPFEGTLEDGSLYLKILDYAPYISAAIHHGHQFREELVDICILDSDERYHEEDPYTGDMIIDSPIVLMPQDSRFEYDLNRNPNDCIHQNAWGKDVWKTQLSDTQKQISLDKHQQFYDICNHLVKTILKTHKHCVVYDVHSYNILDRNYNNPPFFNIGSHFINLSKYRKIVDDWMANLSQAVIKNVDIQVKENDVYYGKGYLAESLQKQYANCLVLPTEVKKIYANETKPEPYLDIIAGVRETFNQAMPKTANALKAL